MMPGAITCHDLGTRYRRRESVPSQPSVHIIPTGGYGKFNPTEKPHVYYLAQKLIELAVDEKCIFGLVERGNTVEDDLLSKQLLEGYSLDSVQVITSEVHIE